MLVRKYGGSSLSSLDQIRYIVDSLPDEPLVVVLSAPFGRTNELYRQSKSLLDSHTKNQFIALGELESCLLFKMVAEHKGLCAEVVSYDKLGLTASQAHGGYIHSCNPEYIQSIVAEGKIAVIPGFHAKYKENLALLKRGGSDDSAIALAIALSARCEVYSNVAAIYNELGGEYKQVSYCTLVKLITDCQSPMSRSAVLMAQANKLEINFNCWDGRQKGTLIAHSDELY